MDGFSKHLPASSREASNIDLSEDPTEELTRLTRDTDRHRSGAVLLGASTRIRTGLR